MTQKRVRPHVNPLSITHRHDFNGFGNTNPVLVDVGAYKGEFTAQLLEKYPEKNYIVFEIRKPIYEKLCKRFAHNKNVVVFDGDAGINIESILKPCMDEGALVEEIFINFPDPWFKERHKKRRFVNTNLLQNITKWIDINTKFVFQTDQKILFDETLEIVRSSNNFEIEFFNGSPHLAQTYWESIKIENGEAIYRMRFWKK